MLKVSGLGLGLGLVLVGLDVVWGRKGTGPPFPGSAIPTVWALGLGIGLGIGLGLGLGLGGPWEWRTPGMADPGNGGPEPMENSACRVYLSDPDGK